MKHKTRLSNLQKRTKLLHSAAFVFGLAFLLTGCFLKQDRTTTVYGTITDQNGLPVDSILVVLRGMRGLTGERLKQIYTDKKGNYEFVTEVAKKFVSVDLAIPFWITENPRFQKAYKGFNVSENGKPTSNCCVCSIGEKTKYDFQLIPK